MAAVRRGVHSVRLEVRDLVNQSTLNTILASVSLFTVLVTLLSGVYAYAQLKLKVDTMWAFQMRRAVSEAVSGGLATLHSPLTFTAKALKTLAPIRDSLIEFGKEHEGESQLEITFKLEAEFGDILLKDFCLPLKTSHGACILAALQIAQGSPVEITFDPYTQMPSLPLMSLHSKQRKL